MRRHAVSVLAGLTSSSVLKAQQSIASSNTYRVELSGLVDEPPITSAPIYV